MNVSVVQTGKNYNKMQCLKKQRITYMIPQITIKLQLTTTKFKKKFLKVINKMAKIIVKINKEVRNCLLPRKQHLQIILKRIIFKTTIQIIKKSNTYSNQINNSNNKNNKVKENKIINKMIVRSNNKISQ